MLTEEDKNRIRLEETYRQELRQQLQENTARKSRAESTLAFLNSGFFLWFLSTVLIGTISFFYARWDKQREDDRRTYEQQQKADHERLLTEGKLDTEIANRLRFVNGVIETQRSSTESTDLRKIVFILEKPALVEYPANVFPEYSNRSFQSLLWELMWVVPSSETWDIDGAFQESKKLNSLYILQIDAAASKSVAASVKKGARKDLHDENEKALNEQKSQLLAEIGLKAFDLERWGKPLVSISETKK